ncbi:hypothetical protein HDE78_004132 [Rhodanobacter sp. K2T2]|nr:hypothetical protein [Rhodanobacter sp. K2T2]NYE31149.1 hypothetical protein [Rhodanobacter sp. K2T2]
MSRIGARSAGIAKKLYFQMESDRRNIRIVRHRLEGRGGESPVAIKERLT